jgi:hypothetical protein
VDPAHLAPDFVWLAQQYAAMHWGERLDAWKISQSLKDGSLQ